MSLVTCDVVESVGVAADVVTPSVSTVLPTTGYARASVKLAVTAMLLISTAIATSTATFYPSRDVIERATAHETLTTASRLTSTLVDTAVATSEIILDNAAAVVEHAVATNTVTTSRSVTLSSSAIATSTAAISSAVRTSVIEKAVATSTLFGFSDYSVTSTGYASSTITGTVLRHQNVVENASAFSTLIVAGAVSTSVIEQASAKDQASILVGAGALVTEHAIVIDRALLDTISLAWVMNTETFGMSRYSALPMASVAVVGGRTFGLGDTGLFEMIGDTDLGAPIEAHVDTGRLLLGSSSVKRVPDVYLTGIFEHEMELSVGVYGQLKGTYTYTVPTRLAEGPRATRVKPGKGLSSVYWKFRLANKEGSHFSVDTIYADVAESTNRRV